MGTEHDAARASMDLYAVLGVQQDVTTDDLKRVYRRLALKHHPDKNPNDEVAQRKFQEISRAYSILSDPKKKKFYDDNGTIEDIDMSVQDFAAVFQDLVGEMFGDFAIKVLLSPQRFRLRDRVLTAARATGGPLRHVASGAPLPPAVPLPQGAVPTW
jgi:DnaJ-class molecular chaperone